MALQRSQGKARPAPAPVDEVPAGQPAPTGTPIARNSDGTVRTPAAATALGAKGGKASAQARQMRQLLGLVEPPVEFAPYVRQAEFIRGELLADLSADVGGGQLSSVVTMLCSMAAQAKAMASLCRDCAMLDAGESQIALLDRADKYDLSCRGHLIAAREIAAKDSQARAKRPNQHTPSWLLPADSK